MGTALAKPSLLDLDSWQLPPEPDPVKKEAVPAQPAAEPKPSTESKPIAKPKASAKSKSRATKAPAKENAGDEIKIEMTGTSNYVSVGDSQDPNEIPVMRRTQQQLAKRLTNTSRFYLIFNADRVAAVDGYLTAPNGARYAFVSFGEETGPFRKFLFEPDGTQQFIAVTDNVAGVLELNAIYQINMGLHEEALHQAYPKAVATVVEDVKNNKKYHVYQIEDTWFLVFDNSSLVKQFSAAEELEEFTQQIVASNAALAPQPMPVPPPPVPPEHRKRSAKHRLKALITGGTTEDKMYLPQVNNPEDYKVDVPPLVPSGPQAGTVLLRDVDGKYMNNK